MAVGVLVLAHRGGSTRPLAGERETGVRVPLRRLGRRRWWMDGELAGSIIDSSVVDRPLCAPAPAAPAPVLLAATPTAKFAAAETLLNYPNYLTQLFYSTTSSPLFSLQKDCF